MNTVTQNKTLQLNKLSDKTQTKKFTKKRIVFASLFVLTLVNIGVLFISDNSLFNKTLIGLIATTCILHYVLMWINTLKSLKEESSKARYKNVLVGVLKLPYTTIKFTFKAIKKIISKTFSFGFDLADSCVDEMVESSRHKHMYDPSFIAADGIGGLSSFYIDSDGTYRELGTGKILY